MNTLNNSFAVTFFIKRYKANKDGLCPIVARITVNGKRLEIYLKRTIHPDNWNTAKGTIRGTREEVIKFNQYLDRFKATIVADYQDMFLQKKLITKFHYETFSG